MLEVAVAQSSAYNGANAGGVLVQGAAHQREEARAHTGLESRGTVNGWSVSSAQATQRSSGWQACRYYEVGDIQDDIRRVMSNASVDEELGMMTLYFYVALASDKSAHKCCGLSVDLTSGGPRTLSPCTHKNILVNVFRKLIVLFSGITGVHQTHRAFLPRSSCQSFNSGQFNGGGSLAAASFRRFHVR